jgi:hypothetical protein
MPVIQPITSSSGTFPYVPNTRTLSINGVTYDLSADRSWTISTSGTGTVTSVALSATMPTGLVASISGSPITSNGTLGLTVTMQSGYAIPTTAKQTEWDTAFSNRITSLTITGSSGAATLVSNVLNIPNYTLSGLGGVPTTRTITINGTSFDLSANRTFSVGTVTSVAALTIGTTGTDITSSVANGTTTPVITLNIPTASATNRGALSSTDWLTFSSKQPAITLTTTGNNGSATLVGATLNIPTYTLVGLGGMANPFSAALGQIIYSNSAGAPLSRAGNVTTTKMFLSSTGDGTNATAPVWEAITPSTLGVVPTTRTLTINGTTFDLSANRTYSVGTVTSVALSVPTGLSITGSPITTSGTLAISLTAGYSIPTTASQTNWDAAYNDKINTASVTGTTTKTLTLTQQDGGTITASWTDANTDAVTSVFGRTGAVVAANGDYTTAQVTESVNLYFTNARAIASTLTGYTSGAGTITSSDSILSAIQKLNGNVSSLVTGVSSVNGFTGVVTLNTTNISEGTNLYYTEARVNANANVAANTAARHNAVTLGTANGLSLSTQVLSLGLASSTTTGALSSTDWTTFNNKQNALTNPITGTGTINYIPKFTSSSVLGNSLIYDTGTNIGINTATPTTLSNYISLHIVGGPSGALIRFSDSTAANRGIIYGSTSETAINAVSQFNLYVDNTQIINALSTGNVGINKLSAASTLEVYKSSGTNYIYTTNGTANTFNGLLVRYNGTDYMGAIGNPNTGEFRIGGFNAGGYYTTIYSNNAETVRVTGGNVGIGTPTPSYKLQVQGTGFFNDNVRFPNTKGLLFENSSASPVGSIKMGTGVTSPLEITNGTNTITLVSIGTAISSNLLIGASTIGTSATNTIAVVNGTAPSSSATDIFHLYSADVTAGNAAPHFRTENGAVIKLYQETTSVGNSIISLGGGSAVLDDTTFDGYTLRQVVKALRNQGILA